jgi:CHAT domain-containing protein
MYLSELIPEVRPVTQLIVLSACETGNGIDYQGEGVFSFNRGFAALGIPSSVMNLWSVDNESTYKLNELFYKYLVKGLPLDVAMQKAKIDFMKSGAKKNELPFYWAAPVLAGKSNPINYIKPFNWSYVVAPILVVALFYLAFILMKRKRKIMTPPIEY